MEDLGGLPRGGENLTQFSYGKTNNWASHEQGPFSQQKPPPAQGSIQRDPALLPLIPCSGQVCTRWPIDGALVSTIEWKKRVEGQEVEGAGVQEGGSGNLKEKGNQNLSLGFEK